MLLEGTTTTKEVVEVVAMVVVGVIQMVVVVEEVVATKMAATNIIMISLETSIRGTTIILIGEGAVEVAGTGITTTIRQLKVVMPQLMLEWLHDVITDWVSIGCQVPSLVGG